MTSERHEHLRALANQLADSPEPMVVVALDGTILRWNAAATSLFGVPARQAEGRPCWEIVAGRTSDGEPICSSACGFLLEARSDRTPPPTEMIIRRRQVAQDLAVMVHHLTLRDEQGQPRALVHLIEDVDERRRRERVGERLIALLTGQGDVEPLLTPREREVLHLLADGRTAREVAEHLGIGHATARNHIQHILSKLGAHNRVAAFARVLAGDGGR